jgi:hypothetical protein
MGLLSSSFISGVGRGLLDIYDKAEVISNEGLENMKVARAEVTQELKDIGDRYDKAQSLADSVGGGEFANYLFDVEGIDNLAALQILKPGDRQNQLSQLKTNFNNLPEESRLKYSEGDYSEKLKMGLEQETEKVKQGLVANNNMGQSTANTLAGKIQRSVDRTFEPRRRDIVESLPSPTMREPRPVQGAFDTIPMLGDDADIPFLDKSTDDQIKFTNAFNTYFKDNYTNINGQVMDTKVDTDLVAILNRAAPTLQVDIRNVNEILMELRGAEPVTLEGFKRNLLMEDYFNTVQGEGSYGDGKLTLLRNNYLGGGADVLNEAIKIVSQMDLSRNGMITELVNNFYIPRDVAEEGLSQLGIS